MKEVPHIYNIIAVIATTCFFLPVVIIAAKKFLRHHQFTWIAGYWLLAGTVNALCISGLIANTRLLFLIERLYNLADAPFMLYVLYKTVNIDPVKKSIQKILLPFLLTAFSITIITRLNNTAESILVAAGLVIVLFYVVWIITFYVRGVKHSNLEYAMQYIYYALLFEYGVSVITFIFSYMIEDKNSVNDSFLIYYIATIVSISLASYGFIVHKEKKPAKIRRIESVGRESEIKYL